MPEQSSTIGALRSPTPPERTTPHDGRCDELRHCDARAGQWIGLRAGSGRPIERTRDTPCCRKSLVDEHLRRILRCSRQFSLSLS
jgi:hypothetical protein